MKRILILLAVLLVAAPVVAATYVPQDTTITGTTIVRVAVGCKGAPWTDIIANGTATLSFLTYSNSYSGFSCNPLPKATLMPWYLLADLPRHFAWQEWGIDNIHWVQVTCVGATSVTLTVWRRYD